MRRSRVRLEQAVTDAHTSAERAQAWYALGLFHDNNNPDAEAIPCYRRALASELDAQTQALAWLASSLMKTGARDAARRAAAQAQRLTTDDSLRKFLAGLRRRIDESGR